MTHKALLLLLVTLGLALSGCKFGRGIAGSGNRKSEKREVQTFNAIDSSGAYDINVDCQKPVSLEIEADDNLLPLIKTEVRGGVLIIKNDQEFHSTKSPVVRITVPDLTRITNGGAGDVKVTAVKNDQISLESDGAASMVANGTTKSIKITSNGAGSIDAGNLQADKAQVSVSGAASIDCYATEQLDVNISGVGNVTYGGNPKTVNKHISGVGSINPKGQ